MSTIAVKINNQVYPAAVVGHTEDAAWNRRESKSITLEMDYNTAIATFVDNAAWSIIYQDDPFYDEINDITVTPEPEEYDNSEFCVAGDLTDHRDGTITVKMGRLTDLESAYEIMLGGIL